MTETPPTLLGRILKQVVLMFAALLVAVLFEWIGMSTAWKEQGLGHSQAMLAQELRNLNMDVVETAPFGSAVSLVAQRFSSGFYRLFAEDLRVAQLLQATTQRQALYQMTGSLGWPPPHHYGLAALNTIQLFGVKLAVVALAMPIYLVFAVWGAGEGLTVRALRRYRAMHESAYVFHHAKRLVWPMVALPVVVYLALPMSLSPVLVFGPCALVYGLAWVVMVSKFKKYW